MRYLVTAKGQPLRYRSGLCFSDEPVEVDGATLSPEQMDAILTDPFLRVNTVTPDGAEGASADAPSGVSPDGADAPAQAADQAKADVIPAPNTAKGKGGK